MSQGPSRSNAIEIVTIGDELLLGFTIDTNAAHLARELAGIGIEIVRRSTVGDEAEQIAEAVRDALDRTGAVITTGGLGPTSDDLTKPSIARLFGRGMVVDEEYVEWLRERWRKRWGREMPESNRLQAAIPEGARKLANNHGSAPGIWLEDERGRWVAMLPGVPREMRGMLADTLLPLLRERVGEAGVVRSRTIRTTGVPESLVADRIDPVRRELGAVSLAYLPSPDGVDLRVTVRGVAPNEADRLLDAAGARLRSIMGHSVYGEDGADLAGVVLDLCRDRHLTMALAESCTGGLLGARLTTIAGSSDVLLGGIIAYHNDVKRAQLDVREADLREYGAVSEPVVLQMATGARTKLSADVGVAVTGIAGPGGGTPEKPVGTVWIAVDFKGDAQSKLLRLFGDRDEIRRRAAQAALDLVRRTVSAD